MRYDNITRAVFLRRPNRFIAEVDIDGRREVVHVKNTGRCGELLIPGCEAWLTEPGTPGRKTRYDLVAVRKSTGVLFNIDSQAPNKAVSEWLSGQGYSLVKPEYKYGDSRIDFYMEKETDVSGAPERYLMEVKGCTLEFDGIGYFPDAPTERGVKHIRELIKARDEGYHAILAFVIQMDGVREVRPHGTTDPEFEKAMKDAEACGVQVLFLTCHVEPGEMVITEAVFK